MRNALGLMLASVVAAVVIAAGGWFYYSARADQGAPKTIAARTADPLPAQAKLAAKDDVETTAAIAAKPAAAAPAPAPAPVMPMQPKQACANPNALGVSRVVEIDTTGGPGFGFEHFKQFDFLTDKEVVLTFDDGPYPPTTSKVLAALAQECVRATFFLIGLHATEHPEMVKRIAREGHTIGHHTFSHPFMARIPFDKARSEIDRGIAADEMALHGVSTTTPSTPFFRFPYFEGTQAQLDLLQSRGIVVFGADLWASDWNEMTPEQELKLVTERLAASGKGIILFHDPKARTAAIMPAFLRYLRENGFRVVHVVAAGAPPKNADAR